MVQSAANIGDIRLLDAISSQDSSGTTKVSGLLQVYFTDGSVPLSWSYVCTDTFYEDEGKTACRQLGYEELYHNASTSVTVSDPTTYVFKKYSIEIIDNFYSILMTFRTVVLYFNQG